MDKHFHIFCLIGASGSGKDTLRKNLCKLGFHNVIGTTSRPMRKGEEEGNPYFFLTKPAFRNKIYSGEMIEYTTNYGNYYGIKEGDIDYKKINIVVNDINGIYQLKHVFGKDKVTAIWINATEKQRRKRMLNRGDDYSKVIERLQEDKKIFEFKKMFNSTDYKIDSYTPLHDLSEALSIINDVMVKKGVIINV